MLVLYLLLFYFTIGPSVIPSRPFGEESRVPQDWDSSAIKLLRNDKLAIVIPRRLFGEETRTPQIHIPQR